jgi:hypothetical protein
MADEEKTQAPGGLNWAGGNITVPGGMSGDAARASGVGGYKSVPVSAPQNFSPGVVPAPDCSEGHKNTTDIVRGK